MKDENGNRSNGQAQDRARAMWSAWHKDHPGKKLPIVKFQLASPLFSPKTKRLESFDLISWTVPGGKKYGWVTGKNGEAGPHGPLAVEVTEIPPDLTPEVAIRDTASPYPLHFLVLAQVGDCFQAQIE